MGRDIVGVEPMDGKSDRRIVIQCVNRSILTVAKCQRDMNAAVKAATGRPDGFKFVSRANVTAETRDKIGKAGKALRIHNVTIWSGIEFEENLRLRAEPLLRRFEKGETFPDSEVKLRAFVDEIPGLSDKDALDQMAVVFERPAFQTPFQSESSLPAFQQAIEDTIRALNTGIWQTREGEEIKRLPSIHHIQDAKVRVALSTVVKHVDAIRHAFKRRLKDKSIIHCQCGSEDCPVFTLSDAAGRELDNLRRTSVETFNRIRGQLD